MQQEMKIDIPYGRPMLGDEEKRAALEVLSGPILVHGPRAHEFERNFSRVTGAEHSVSVSSCTAALHLCYFYLGIRPGDEVIVPAETHVATAHAVELCGGKAVFVDAERRTGNIDIDQIESKLSERTRAISIVHYLGMPVDMDKVNEIARKRGLFVVEDAALAMGTYYKGRHAGALGDAGCFSFYPVKHMTTAEGGMLTTRHREMAEKVLRLKAFGVDKAMHERTTPGVYDAPMLGLNYRMNEIQAAIGMVQLNRMPAFLAARKENYDALSKFLREIDEIHLFQSTHGDFQSSYYCHAVVLRGSLADRKAEVVRHMKSKGVGTSVHYPKSVPQLGYYREKYGYRPEEHPVAHWISEGSIALPVGPHLGVEDMRRIADTLKSAISEVNR